MLLVAISSRVSKSLVILAPAQHVCGRRPIVAAGLAIDALAGIAAVIDALVAAEPPERGVRQLCPSLARPLNPGRPVKRPTLRCPAPVRVFRIGATDS